jgi:hypothetical protein
MVLLAVLLFFCLIRSELIQIESTGPGTAGILAGSYDVASCYPYFFDDVARALSWESPYATADHRYGSVDGLRAWQCHANNGMNPKPSYLIDWAWEIAGILARTDGNARPDSNQ